jgi:hypothetical protein
VILTVASLILGFAICFIINWHAVSCIISRHAVQKPIHIHRLSWAGTSNTLAYSLHNQPTRSVM